VTAHLIKGTQQFECNACGDEFDTGESDWYDACTVLAEEEWIARKIDSSWSHFCGPCAKKRRKEERRLI
jgi:hypothetical protein